MPARKIAAQGKDLEAVLRDFGSVTLDGGPVLDFYRRQGFRVPKKLTAPSGDKAVFVTASSERFELQTRCCVGETPIIDYRLIFHFPSQSVFIKNVQGYMHSFPPGQPKKFFRDIAESDIGLRIAFDTTKVVFPDNPIYINSPHEIRKLYQKPGFFYDRKNFWNFVRERHGAELPSFLARAVSEDELLANRLKHTDFFQKKMGLSDEEIRAARTLFESHNFASHRRINRVATEYVDAKHPKILGARRTRKYYGRFPREHGFVYVGEIRVFA